MKAFLSVCLLIVASSALSQAPAFDLDKYNKERVKITKNSMLVLGSWAVGNIIWGGVGWAGSKTDGSHKYFHQMNFAWGAVNGLLAGISLAGSKKLNRTMSFSESVKAQRNTEKLYLINAGLDVAYIGTGAWLVQKSKTSGAKNPAQLEGFGNSLMIQGGFLLLFDGIMYAIHNKRGKQLFKQLDNFQLSAGPTQISLLVKL
jgi:hypothetical protein